jgi:hypothetical protein
MLQSRKMVPIEEAATEFGLRSSEVVDRIQGLESMGRLTGEKQSYCAVPRLQRCLLCLPAAAGGRAAAVKFNYFTCCTHQGEGLPNRSQTGGS